MKTIRIATESGIRETKAHVFGVWAAHERWQYGPNWVVTLLGDGRCMDNDGDRFGVLDEVDAIAVARAMDASGFRSIEQLRGQLFLVEAIVAEALALVARVSTIVAECSEFLVEEPTAEVAA